VYTLGAPFVILRLALGMIWLHENGPPPSFWHVRQWHRTCEAEVRMQLYVMAPQWQEPV
jgi:hypothetical protein